MSGRKDFEERKERRKEIYEERIENADSEKADYYREKLEILENNNMISSDDPKAKQKLQKRIMQLEKLREDIKAKEHSTYTLQRISAEKRRLKERLKELEELEELDFKEITFDNGKIIHNNEVNRVQILFDNIPDKEVRDILKKYGFKWAKSQGAWQRLFNKNCIIAVKYIMNELEKIKNYTFERNK